MPGRRTRKAAAKKEEVTPEVELAPQHQDQEEPVPAKKTKIESPTQDDELTAQLQQDQAEIAQTNENAKESSISVELRDPNHATNNRQIQPKWTILRNCFLKREAQHFFSYMNQSKMDENNQVKLTIAVNSYVWSQTVDIKDHKKTKENLAEAVLNHFEIENLQAIHPDDFNIGPTPTMLLEKYLGDKVVFTTEMTSNDSDNPNHNSAPLHMIEMRVDGESVEAEKVTNRSMSHEMHAKMALKYIKANVDDYIKVITDIQNIAASGEPKTVTATKECPVQVPAQHGQPVANGAPPAGTPMGWQMMTPMQVQQMMMAQGMNMGQMMGNMGNMNNGWNALKQPNGNQDEEPADQAPVAAVTVPIENGSTWSQREVQKKLQCFDAPICLLHSTCAKNKLKLTTDIQKSEDTNTHWTCVMTLEEENFTIKGTGQGRRAKDTAAIVMLTHLKNQGKFDETQNYVNKMVKQAKRHESGEVDASQMIQYMQHILEEKPEFKTDDGTGIGLNFVFVLIYYRAVESYTISAYDSLETY